MSERRWWVRAALAVLGLQLFVTGLWAVVDPLGWYKGFPGLGRHWVVANGPYDQHLAVDAGSGFLAIGVLMFVALLWSRRDIIQAAFIAYLISDIPHFLFHAMHPAKALTTTDNALSIGGLAFATAIAAACLIAVSVRSSARSAVEPLAAT